MQYTLDLIYHDFPSSHEPSQKEPTEDWSEGLSTYIEIFSSKKTSYSPVKNSSQFFLTFFTFTLSNFLVQTLQYFQKKKKYFLLMKT